MPVLVANEDGVAAIVGPFIATYLPPTTRGLPSSDLPRTIFLLAHHNITLVFVGLEYYVWPMMFDGVLL